MIGLLPLDYQTEKKIEKLARATGKPKEKVVSELVQEGLKTYRATPSKSVKAALDLIEWAEKEQITGTVNDLSTNHNKYAWDE